MSTLSFAAMGSPQLVQLRSAAVFISRRSQLHKLSSRSAIAGLLAIICRLTSNGVMVSAETVYLQGYQTVEYELSDPQHLVLLQDASCTTKLSALKSGSFGSRFKITVELSQRHSRTPFSADKLTQRTQNSALSAASIARTLTSSCRYQYEAVAAILNWIADAITYDASEDAEEPETVLTIKRASCRGLSSLAGVMLAAVGIKTRQIHGYLAAQPLDSAPPQPQGNFHRWIEVYYPDLG